MKITPEIIAACKKAGACKEGLAYISVKGRTIEELYEFNREWFFWLKRILSRSARDAYDATEKPARDAYDAAVKPAWDAYNAAVKTASAAYDAAVKTAWDACDAAVKTASAAYNAAEKPARDAYNAAVKTALIDALRKTFA